MNAPGLPTPVVVNGHPTDLPHRVCARCVQDTSVPGIRFDAAGVCTFCALHDELARTFPKGAAGRAALARMADGSASGAETTPSTASSGSAAAGTAPGCSGAR